MNILYTFNNGFVSQVGTSLVSVCENNKESQINFYLICSELSEKNKQLFQSFEAKYNCVINIIDLLPIKNYFDFSFDTLGWNNIILARLLMAKLLPSTIDRIIYLDGDTIVLSSLKQLWETDMGKKVIGMVIEPTVDQSRKKDLELANYSYHNSGVLLVNLNKWRELSISDKIINYYKEKNGVLFAADQDAINVILRGQILSLPPKYNYCNTYSQYPYYFLKKLMGKECYYSREIYDESIRNPIIIHFLGEERPWRDGNRHEYKNEFDYYLKLTPWADYPKEKGWKTYFVCWYAFNLITKRFPSIRYAIINRLIPLFMKIRRKKLEGKK